MSETIADIIEEKRSEAQYIRENNDTLIGRKEALKLEEEADRIEAAYKREVAELRECLTEAVTEVCNRLEKCGFKEPCVFKTCYVQKWRKALQDEGDTK